MPQSSSDLLLEEVGAAAAVQPASVPAAGEVSPDAHAAGKTHWMDYSHPV